MQQLIATASGGDIRLWNLHSLSFEGGVIGHQVSTTFNTVSTTTTVAVMLTTSCGWFCGQNDYQKYSV
jgi:hypothetical protein